MIVNILIIKHLSNKQFVLLVPVYFYNNNKLKSKKANALKDKFKWFMITIIVTYVIKGR